MILRLSKGSIIYAKTFAKSYIISSLASIGLALSVWLWKMFVNWEYCGFFDWVFNISNWTKDQRELLLISAVLIELSKILFSHECGKSEKKIYLNNYSERLKIHNKDGTIF